MTGSCRRNLVDKENQVYEPCLEFEELNLEPFLSVLLAIAEYSSVVTVEDLAALVEVIY